MESTGNRLTIKAWAEEDRPREKLLQKGKHVLTEAELLAILVGSGTTDDSAVDVCKKLLARVENDVGALSRMSVHDIVKLKVKGIGNARAIAIVAALELGRRRQSATIRDKGKITSSRDLFELMAPLGDLTHEEFHVVYLNIANKIIAQERLSSGGLVNTAVDARMIFKKALDHKATYIAVAHNHPSGNLKPSPADLKLTRALSDAGKLLDIGLLDHVIISDSSYYSFADDGKL
jgi:DNA repair protein RadC